MSDWGQLGDEEEHRSGQGSDRGHICYKLCTLKLHGLVILQFCRTEVSNRPEHCISEAGLW